MKDWVTILGTVMLIHANNISIYSVRLVKYFSTNDSSLTRNESKERTRKD
jgi:hypothetical protein